MSIDTCAPGGTGLRSGSSDLVTEAQHLTGAATFLIEDSGHGHTSKSTLPVVKYKRHRPEPCWMITSANPHSYQCGHLPQLLAQPVSSYTNTRQCRVGLYARIRYTSIRTHRTSADRRAPLRPGPASPDWGKSSYFGMKRCPSTGASFGPYECTLALQELYEAM